MKRVNRKPLEHLPRYPVASPSNRLLPKDRVLPDGGHPGFPIVVHCAKVHVACKGRRQLSCILAPVAEAKIKVVKMEHLTVWYHQGRVPLIYNTSKQFKETLLNSL